MGAHGWQIGETRGLFRVTHCSTEEMGQGRRQARRDGGLSGMRIGMQDERRPDGAGRSRDLGLTASGESPFRFSLIYPSQFQMFIHLTVQRRHAVSSCSDLLAQTGARCWLIARINGSFAYLAPPLIIEFREFSILHTIKAAFATNFSNKDLVYSRNTFSTH